MKPKNEGVFRKKTERLSDPFHRGRDVPAFSARTVLRNRVSSGRASGRLLAVALLRTSFCHLMAILLFLHTPANARAQAVGAETLSDPGAACLPAPVTITLGKRTLSGALASQGIPQSTIARIAQALDLHLNLRQLQPKDTLQLYYSPEGAVTRVVYRQSPLDIFEVHRQEHNWNAYKRDMDVDRRVTLVAGTLENTLLDSIEKLGESPRLVFDFAGIFAWVFDFAADSQPGDRFRMIVEKLYVEGQFVQYARILAAEYESGHTVHTATYFQEKGRGDYYTPDGESLRRAFLKSPLDFSRISSRYNRNRRHPILGGVRPHLAVDYAAPTGTPVWAVADGMVKFAGWKSGYGKTVVLNHKASYQTIYSHLSRFGKGIRSGTKVLQRQVIGYLGSTGVTTGPHLDYRVMKGGRLVDPLKQTFLRGEPVSQSSWSSFVAARDSYLLQLRSSLRPKATTQASKDISESLPGN
ncbi:MAG: M23 family metallopeptidase [Desulfobacterales bacterium]|nr:M23 family metallopeptidase [Desulfobacterales bacterium]